MLLRRGKDIQESSTMVYMNENTIMNPFTLLAT